MHSISLLIFFFPVKGKLIVDFFYFVFRTPILFFLWYFPLVLLGRPPFVFDAVHLQLT